MPTFEETAEKKRYELMLIVDGTKKDADLEASVQNVKEMIGQFTNTVFHEDVWGKRELMYSIKAKGIGYYIVLGFEIEPEKIHELETALRLEVNILRYLLLTLPGNETPKKYAEVVKEIPANLSRRKPVSLSALQNVEKKEREAASKKRRAAVPTVVIKTKKVEKKPQVSLEEVEERLKKIVENPDIEM